MPAAPGEGGQRPHSTPVAEFGWIPKHSLAGVKTNQPNMKDLDGGRWKEYLGGFRREVGRGFLESAEGPGAVKTRKFTLFPKHLAQPPEDLFL